MHNKWSDICIFCHQPHSQIERRDDGERSKSEEERSGRGVAVFSPFPMGKMGRLFGSISVRVQVCKLYRLKNVKRKCYGFMV